MMTHTERVDVIAKVLALARHELGVHEQGGNNRGPRVEEYLRSVGQPPGQPWCAAFVRWCIDTSQPQLHYPTSGYCPWLQDWSRKIGIQTPNPTAGDQFLLLATDGTGEAEHTGFVDQVNSDGTFNTVEGNTGDGTGIDGVHRKIRRISSCVFIHWVGMP